MPLLTISFFDCETVVAPLINDYSTQALRLQAKSFARDTMSTAQSRPTRRVKKNVIVPSPTAAVVAFERIPVGVYACVSPVAELHALSADVTGIAADATTPVASRRIKPRRRRVVKITTNRASASASTAGVTINHEAKDADTVEMEPDVDRVTLRVPRQQQHHQTRKGSTRSRHNTTTRYSLPPNTNCEAECPSLTQDMALKSQPA